MAYFGANPFKTTSSRQIGGWIDPKKKAEARIQRRLAAHQARSSLRHTANTHTNSSPPRRGFSRHNSKEKLQPHTRSPRRGADNRQGPGGARHQQHNPQQHQQPQTFGVLRSLSPVEASQITGAAVERVFDSAWYQQEHAQQFTKASPNARGPGAHGVRAQQAAAHAEAAQVPAYFAPHHAPHRISPGKHHQPLHDKDKHHQLRPLDTGAGSAAYQPGLGLSLRAQRRREKPTPKITARSNGGAGGGLGGGLGGGGGVGNRTIRLGPPAANAPNTGGTHAHPQQDHHHHNEEVALDHFYASNGTVEMPHWSHKFEDKITADHIGLDMVPSNNLNFADSAEDQYNTAHTHKKHVSAQSHAEIQPLKGPKRPPGRLVLIGGTYRAAPPGLSPNGS